MAPRPNIADEDLARAARAGARDAFDRLVDRHATRLYRFLRMRAPTAADADDLLQDTFLLCWRKLAHYDASRPFPQWLFKLGANVAASRARQRRENEQLALEELTGGTDPAQVACELEAGQNLWDMAHHALPPVARTALWLFYAEDEPAAAIAEILGKSEGAVRILLFRARARLAAVLGAHANTSQTMTVEAR
jgi:RNA polymerase sigma-70 factor (ECF subfamily)